MKQLLKKSLTISILTFSIYTNAEVGNSILQIKNKEEARQVLKQGAFYLFTNPESCKPCQYLEEKLKKSGQENDIKINYEGVEYRLPLKKINPWSGGQKELNQNKKMGYLNYGIPQFSINSEGKIYGTGLFKSTNEKAISKIKKNDLLPIKSENLEGYTKRLQGLYENVMKNGDSNFDVSADVLSSIGIEKKGVLRANENFKPLTDSNNVLVVGTASLTMNNPLFTGITIDKVLNSISEFTDQKPTVLYGSGKLEICDTCQVVTKKSTDEKEGLQKSQNQEKKREIVKYALRSDESPTKENIVSFYKSANENKSKKNLMVLVGHGTPEGFPTWLDVINQFSPADMKKISKNMKSENIIVSGNCYGGIMAESVTCGFFAANPKITASGCWEDAESGKDLKDFVSLFFESLSQPNADLNHDGQITFAEANAFASVSGVKEDKPFTSMDALAEKFFKENPNKLVESLSSSYLKTLAEKVGSTEEKEILNNLLQDQSGLIYFADIKGNVDFGSVKAEYSYDTVMEQMKFENIQVLDGKALQEKGMIKGDENLNIRSYLINGKREYQLYGKDTDPEFWVQVKIGKEKFEKSLENVDLKELSKNYGNLALNFEEFSAQNGYLYKDKNGAYSGSFKNIEIKNEKLFLDLEKVEKIPEDAKWTSFILTTDQNNNLVFHLKYKSESRKEKENPSKYLSELKLKEELSLNKSISNPTVQTVAKRLLFKAFVQKSNDSKALKRMKQIEQCEQQDVREFMTGQKFDGIDSIRSEFKLAKQNKSLK